MKKALIFDPYLDTLGGGERYALGVGMALSNLGFSVDVAWHQPDILVQANLRFGLDYSPLIIRNSVYQVLTLGNTFTKRKLQSEYDLVFYVSDGSLPLMGAKLNLLHFQVPFKKIGGNFLTNLIKTSQIDYFVYNSHFTSNVVAPQLPLSKSFVLYPPISVSKFTNQNKKEKLILSVARFDSPSHSKRQDVLIDAFRQLHLLHPDYRLQLMGGLKGDEDMLTNLRSMVGNLPIDIIINPDFQTILAAYQKAQFFFHAAGFGIDENSNPEVVEHFGIVTVEAMASGCIPVVIDRGGQREIVRGNCGFLVNSVQEMVAQTSKVITDQSLSKSLSENAVQRAADFSEKNFIESLATILK